MRVSTTAQKHDLQRKALLDAGVLPGNIYQDTISGAKTTRSGLNHCINSLRKGDTLVVWKIDRLGRTASHLFDLVSQLKDRDVNFVSLTENFDTSTPMGWAMFQFMGVFAELERNTIKERVTAGIAAFREEHPHKQWGAPPIDKKTQARVRRQLREGKSIRQVAANTSISKTKVGEIRKGLKL